MDQIEFIRRKSNVEDYQVLDIYLNGFNLLNIIEVEEQLLFPKNNISAVPGNYEGIPPLLALPPKQHFWGIADPCYQIAKGRVAVLENGRSGIPTEWTVSVEITVDGEKVTWQGFRQEQVGLLFSGIGPFYFDLSQYNKQLKWTATP